MPIFIDEHKPINENAFLYEERIKSPSSRLLDTTQTYVTYYHINNLETTTDTGFVDVASIIGFRSPIRFDKIENFPIYGLDQIVLQLQDTDAGLDSSYEGEATIIPGTIKPLHNDFFIIPTLNDSYLFRVTDIQYDNIMADNFYKINFKLEENDQDKLNELENQKLEDYVCILENIGTEINCIVEKSIFTKIEKISEMYNEIADFYKAMFYDERHNVFLGFLEHPMRLYDPLQSEFINKHNLFNEKRNLQALILTEQYDDPMRKFKYAKSIYKYIELRDMKLLNRFPFTIRNGLTIHESTFYRWHSKNIEVMEILTNEHTTPKDYIFSEEYKDQVFYNTDADTDYGELLKKYLRKETIEIKDIPLTLSDELIMLNNSLEVFFFTPIIMYILKEVIRESLN